MGHSLRIPTLFLIGQVGRTITSATGERGRGRGVYVHRPGPQRLERAREIAETLCWSLYAQRAGWTRCTWCYTEMVTRP